MENKELLQTIRESLVDGKLSCARAYQIAAVYDVELQEIGKICDEEKIKIAGCQLGCF